MSGDYSRVRFDHRIDLSGVLMQGRRMGGASRNPSFLMGYATLHPSYDYYEPHSGSWTQFGRKIGDCGLSRRGREEQGELS